MSKHGLTACLVFIAISVSAVLAGVSQTKHNFTSATYSPNAYFLGTNQVCVYCHTPHNGSLTMGALYNHQTNESQPYQMYSSSTLDMTISAAPHKGSLVCLSCHDGTIAVNSLSNLPGPQGAGNYGSPGGSALDANGRLTVASDAFVGTDLRDDHPVGVLYDASRDPSGFVAKTGIATSYPDKLLSEGLYVECNSCHDPHDNTYSNFLVESNATSQLCMRCHTK
ncbi:MAG: cytochrome c3 family protein [Candidatus Kerfeldbacteria bacterium]|nr:cytochrome c3 family protein [Candidatus Kerfeldbacteria bacterium]